MTYPWDLTNTVATLTTIMAAARPKPGDVVIARLQVGTQELVGHRTLAAPTTPAGLDMTEVNYPLQAAMSDQLGRAAQELSPPNRIPAFGIEMTGILVTLVCRTGRAVITANELQWSNAWRFSNHMTDAFHGELFAMTPHGWISEHHQAALTPALGSSRASLRLVP